MFSIHGLVRSRNIEMGRDADTGGQVKYVIELAEALGRQENVDRVDLFTRRINDKRVSSDYNEEIEPISDTARIIRVRCGGGKYHRKELLWPFLNEYVDNVLAFCRKEGRLPDVIHGHYADGGYVARNLSKLIDVPYIFTGHSMGRVKKARLMEDGMTDAEVNRQYNIDYRILAEEKSIANASLIVTSTTQEVTKQYGLYTNKNRALSQVIPPGVDLEKFHPYYDEQVNAGMDRDELSLQAQSSMLDELNRFFLNPDKPLILSLCRPDKRKNISGLIQAYGEDKDLQAMANLAVFAGIRKDITDKEDNEKEVLTDILLHMDKYDLYGKMAIPKTHTTFDVPALYRIAALSRGLFVNPALTEPFGLTLLESAGSGLPVVATDDGGPVDIMSNCKNGVVVDVTKPSEIARAIKEVLVDREKWKAFSSEGINGVKKHYTWESHCQTYLESLNILLSRRKPKKVKDGESDVAIGKRLLALNKLIVTDIDNTLTGDDEAQKEVVNIVEKYKDQVGVCFATGRSRESANDFLKKLEIPIPDILISSVGSEIYYGKNMIKDKGWASHIEKQWDRSKVETLLSRFDFLQLQENENQRFFKLSYYMTPHPDRIPAIFDLLAKNKLRVSLIYSSNRDMDILPYRVSKGKAVKYISTKWDIAPEKILVCGDSGNDMEMMSRRFRGVVVANYSSEMEALKGHKNVHFSAYKHAAGVLDGIRYYGLLDRELILECIEKLRGKPAPGSIEEECLLSYK